MNLRTIAFYILLHSRFLQNPNSSNLIFPRIEFISLIRFLFLGKNLNSNQPNTRLHAMGSKPRSDNPHSGDGASPGFVSFSIELCLLFFLTRYVWITCFFEIGHGTKRRHFFNLQEDFHRWIGQRYDIRWVFNWFDWSLMLVLVCRIGF